MKRTLILTILALFALSCDHTGEETSIPSAGTFILNNGNWGDNDSNIGVYNPADKTLVPNAFLAANGFSLGDLGQDMIVFEDEIYIAVNGSQTVFVTDMNLKVKVRIELSHNGVRLSPRAAVCSDDKVYVSCYEGFVAEIDPIDHSYILTESGPNPDGMTICAGKIYVADSGGMAYPEYNNTVTVISTNGFTKVGTIRVNVNPVALAADDGGKRVYVFSYGDYSSSPARLQVIDTDSGQVSDTGYESVSAIASRGNILYVLCAGYDRQWNPLPGVVYCHDMSSDKPMGKFVTDSTVLKSAYSISAPADGYVYVGCSDYRNTGDVFVFTPDGRFHDKFDSCGLNPILAL